MSTLSTFIQCCTEVPPSVFSALNKQKITTKHADWRRSKIHGICKKITTRAHMSLLLLYSRIQSIKNQLSFYILAVNN